LAEELAEQRRMLAATEEKLTEQTTKCAAAEARLEERERGLAEHEQVLAAEQAPTIPVPPLPGERRPLRSHRRGGHGSTRRR